MDIDRLREAVRNWKVETDDGARAEHLKTIRAFLQDDPPAVDDPLVAALAGLDMDVPNWVDTLCAALETGAAGGAAGVGD